MKRGPLLIPVLVLLAGLLIALPAFAGNGVNLNINGDAAAQFEVMLKDGYSMVPVDAYARFAGAGVEWTAENAFKITENGATLSMTVGQKDALFQGKPLVLSCAPVKAGDKVYLPLRSVSEAFGYEVGWDNQQRLVTLKRSETRNGMTPEEMLVKANQATMDINTYSMEGGMDMNISVVADGKPVGEVPGNMKINMAGQYQNQPVQIYMKQNIVPAGVPGQIPEMAVETYMTEEKMYMKVPGQEWVVQDMPFAPEFWKQQRDIQSDPLKAAAQMKEMGMLLNFGNDVSIDGREYYVINSTLDMNKFRQGFQKLMQQAIQSMPPSAGTGDPALVQQQLQKLLENSKVDYYYTVYVNKKTMITDVVKFNALMELTMNPSELGSPGDAENKTGIPKEVKTKIAMKGEFKIDNLGSPFVAPDVSNARPVDEMQSKPGEQATN